MPLYCHLCRTSKGLVLLRQGYTICKDCLYDLDVDLPALHPAIRHQFKFTPVVNPRGNLDFIGAQLMANFLYNGMTISAVSRQMGITRKTVYDRLKKYDLIKKTDSDKVRLNPTLSDIGHAGALHRMRIKQTDKLAFSVSAKVAKTRKDLKEYQSNMKILTKETK